MNNWCNCNWIWFSICCCNCNCSWIFAVIEFNYSQLLSITTLICISIFSDVNPFVLSYVYTYEIPKPLRLLYVYIYVHGLCDRNMGLLPASNRHFTVSPASNRHFTVFTCFRSAAGSHFTACLPTEEKLSLLRVVRCFWWVLENYDCRTKFNSSLGMEYNGKL